MNRLKTWFMSWLFPWIPKRLLSRMTGLLMRVPIPSFCAGPAIRAFAAFFKIDVNLAERDVATYGSLDDFFTRKLKPGARAVAGQVVHPVDGRLTEQGRVWEGQLLQAKGWSYELAEFLGDAELARVYEGGSYFTYYLCPADYHRVHSAASGDLKTARHIPGLLWPVNQWSVHNIRRLFNLNERVVLNFAGVSGRWSLVLVGATNVGHITITVDPSITTNRWMWHAPTDRHYDPPPQVQTGDELGIFHLGSTVICLFEKGYDLPLGLPRPVRWGERLA